MVSLSGTAGIPILDILRGADLVNVLVIVTRYFGGILLGTGGLVRAYGGVAKLALEKTSKVEIKLCTEYKIIIDYDNYNSLQHYCRNNDIRILSTVFQDKVEINLLVVNSNSEKFLSNLSEITNRNYTYRKIDMYYSKWLEKNSNLLLQFPIFGSTIMYVVKIRRLMGGIIMQNDITITIFDDNVDFAQILNKFLIYVILYGL